MSVHNYPERGKVKEALETLKGFSVVIEETFPLACSIEELQQFIERSQGVASGWIGFYWGQSPEDLRPPKTISDAMTLGWLDFFRRHTKAVERQPQ